ncbi:hypothetical protein [Xanthobacter aminoxidans]|uniref:hypothetical protein n=1 Tax=Xanthobacter aminoxidans TaxID=186280 RepID=UPI002022E8D2|nr:hypothetical protein [Xanthobacter aminoxidans]MCL8383428.1 hypothetical protein [Xanthobacter aminoxidans]
MDHRLIAAARITLGSAIATFAVYAAGASHPAWAAMGAQAVMQGTHLHINMSRALQRMAAPWSAPAWSGSSWPRSRRCGA